MTDNAFAYVRNRSLRELLNARGIRHLTTQPYRPRTNGKVERFHQTMAREWAYGLIYPTHRERATALPHWLEHYNHRRPHSQARLAPRSGAETCEEPWRDRVGTISTCASRARVPRVRRERLTEQTNPIRYFDRPPPPRQPRCFCARS